MRQFLVLLFCFSVSGSLFSQAWDNYKPIVSAGTIPDLFTEAYYNKYKREIEKTHQDDVVMDDDLKENFYKKTEYYLDEFLISGKILFGDSLTLYCNTIMDHLLKDYPEIRKEIDLYVVKDPAVNAFATRNGVLFVNMGLIAQVENEAQLAYVLSHELVHYLNEHVLNQYIEEIKIIKGEDLYNNSTRNDRINAMSAYSKSNELEADREGFNKFYKNSGYTHRSPVYVMDVLQYSYLPFDEIPLDTTFLETETMQVPRDYFIEEVAGITAEDDYDDSQSTHPNIKTRKEEIIKYLNGQDTGKVNIISEAWFNKSQRMARYEIARSYLKQARYADAIYHCFLLEKKYGTDRFQRLIMAKALCAASVYRNKRNLGNVTRYWRKVEGESQQVFHILNEYDTEDLNTLAVAYSYELLRDYSDDAAIKAILNKALKELVYTNNLGPSDFAKEESSQKEVIESLFQNDSSVASLRSSKIKNIKKKKSSADFSDEDYYKNGLRNYFNDTLFSGMFSRIYQEYKDAGYQEREAYKSTPSIKQNQDPKNLGIDSILCLTPEYVSLDSRVESRIRYTATAKGLDELQGYISDFSQDMGLYVQTLDYKNIESTEIDRYNDLSTLKDWVNERLRLENSGALISNFDEIEDLIEKYGTPYIAYTGNVSALVKEKSPVFKVIRSLALFPLLPGTILDLSTPDYDCFNYFFLFDLRSGTAHLADYHYYSSSNSPSYVKSILYNNLIQIKGKK